MRRVPLLLVLLLFVMFSLGVFTVYAEEGESSIETKTQLQVTATIPDGFDKTILISLTSKDQTNVMSRLDQENGYKVAQEIPEGMYQIGFINIVGGNVTNYNIEVTDTFEVIAGKETQLPLKLALKNSVQNHEPSKEVESPVSDTKAVLNFEPSSIPNVSGNINRSIGPVDSISLPENPTTLSQPTAAAKVSLSDSHVKVIIGLAIFGLIALLLFLYRQISYKHDYYDC